MSAPRIPLQGLRGLRGTLKTSSSSLSPSPVLNSTLHHHHHHRQPPDLIRPITTTTTNSSNTPSVDPSEITHFTALASSWWDPHGPSRLLHLMNPLRHDFLAQCRASSSSSSPDTRTGTETEIEGTINRTGTGTGKTRYLDVGCGGGIFAESVARLSTTESVVGLDPTRAVLEVARAHALQDPALAGKLLYVEGDIETFSSSSDTDNSDGNEDEKKYDVISVFEVLEHVPNPQHFLLSTLPLLRPGGWLVGSTIARTFASWVTTKLVAEHLLGIVPPGTHDWDKYVNVDEVREYLLAPRATAATTATVAGDGGDGEVMTACWDMESLLVVGVVYVPGFGWREVQGSEKIGNYFFGIRRNG